MENHANMIGNISSVTVAITTLVGWLPPIAAALSIIWTVIQIVVWYKNRTK